MGGIVQYSNLYLIILPLRMQFVLATVLIFSFQNFYSLRKLFWGSSPSLTLVAMVLFGKHLKIFSRSQNTKNNFLFLDLNFSVTPFRKKHSINNLFLQHKCLSHVNQCIPIEAILHPNSFHTNYE